MREALGRALRAGTDTPEGQTLPWLARGSILLLQLKLIWGMWQLRDLPIGDTSGYFARAALWRDGMRVDVVWSPLYTAFYGGFLGLSPDAYTATTLHRMAIVLIVSLLVLAVARRLLPTPLAWGVAVWWVLLPVHFDTIYEVHLFAVIPVLAAWWVILAVPSPVGRGSGLGILCVTALLLRNEFVVAVVLFALACAWLERHAFVGLSASDRLVAARRLAAAYGLPLLAASTLTLFFHSRSITKGSDLAAASRPKHTVNMCQAYAFGWQQRHPEWTSSPWTGCSSLMAAHFGSPTPTLLEMWRHSPKRVLEHFAWNGRLTPAGIQLLLFNVASSDATPDYLPVTPRPVAAWAATVVVALLWVTGFLAARRLRTHVFQERALSGWLSMAAVAGTALVVIPTQRPRPAYLFAFGISLALLTARFAALILEWRRVSPRGPLLLASGAAMVAAPLLAPRYYEWRAPAHRTRPLLTSVRRLAPFGALIRAPGTVTLVSDYAAEIEGYVGQSYGRPLSVLPTSEACRFVTGETLGACLERSGATLLYLAEESATGLRRRTEDEAFLSAPERFGWARLAPTKSSSEGWVLFRRERPSGTGAAPPPLSP